MHGARTQVGIIGAGPAGLLLAQLLHLRGIDSVLLESRSCDHVLGRIRAGVMEQGTVDTLIEAGVGARLQRECMPHRGIYFRFGDTRHYLDIEELSGGRRVTVYGQQEITRDLIEARHASGRPLLFEAHANAVEGLETRRALIHYMHADREHTLACDFVAGCDGFHGLSRATLPARARHDVEHQFPFAWLGVLAAAPPATNVVTYAHHARGFALLSMRSPQLSRLYLQCAPDEDVANWTDQRIWDELQLRLGGGDLVLTRGEILHEGITPMRSHVTAPMQHERLFLAGDAAHVVPPTGAKGMNLAVADVRVLATALARHYRGDDTLLRNYSRICLDRVWKVQRFSWWATSMFHIFPGQSEFDTQMQLASLSYLTSSRAGGQSYAENYVGLPFAV